MVAKKLGKSLGVLSISEDRMHNNFVGLDCVKDGKGEFSNNAPMKTFMRFFVHLGILKNIVY